MVVCVCVVCVLGKLYVDSGEGILPQFQVKLRLNSINFLRPLLLKPSGRKTIKRLLHFKLFTEIGNLRQISEFV